MITLCIAAILASIAIPSSKKALHDMEMNTFVENLAVIIKSTRNYYLIFNEWPPDDFANNIPNEHVCCLLQKHLYKGTELTYRPLGDTSNYIDFDNWLQSGSSGTMLINVNISHKDKNACFKKLSQIPFFKDGLNDASSTLQYIFPECPANQENRYF